MKNLYNLKLHEKICLEGGLVQITRVAGGWIYRFWEQECDTNDLANYRVNSVFVPYNQEFDTGVNPPKSQDQIELITGGITPKPLKEE